MRTSLLILALFSLPALAQDEGESEGGAGIQRATRVAVSSFDTSGVDERIATIFTNSLLAEVRKLERVSVIGMDEVRAMLDLEAQKQLVGCEDDSCLAEIAGALGADVLIIGGLARVGDESILDLKRIDQRKAKVTGSVNQRLVPAGGEEFLAAVGPAVEQLFFDHPLRAGQERGVSKEMALRLNPPPLPRTAFYIGAGSTGAFALVAAVAGSAWGIAMADYNRTVELAAAEGATLSGRILKDKENGARAAETTFWTGVILTLTAGAVTGGMVPFVDWQGHAEAE